MDIITKENVKNTVDNSISVVYHKFQSYCVEENKEKLFCFFEGKDAPYYSSRVKKYFENNYYNFKCNNKKNVLKIYNKIKNKKEDFLLAFFVDSDFDNKLSNNDIYETPTYSVENFYCTEEAISNIIKNEYYLNEQDPEFSKILSFYKQEIIDYLDKILLFNAWYYSLKIKKELLGLNSTNVSLDEKLPNKFLKLEIGNIQANYTLDCITKEYINSIQVTSEEVEEAKIILNSKELLMSLRGKYIITFLIKFIDYINQDSKNNKNFLKESVNFSTNKSIVLGHLSDYAITPQCLDEYLNNMASASA